MEEEPEETEESAEEEPEEEKEEVKAAAVAAPAPEEKKAEPENAPAKEAPVNKIKGEIIFGYLLANLYLCNLKQLTDEPIVNSENLPSCEPAGFRPTDAT